jgi:predicted RNase H-like HicB family nuclease
MKQHRLELHVEVARETDGRWIADVVDLPGAMAYGQTEAEALARVKALALEIIADRLSHGEDPLTGCALGEQCPPDEYAASLSSVGFAPVEMVC